MDDNENALTPGTWIEEFEIERELQSSGLGVTYLAHDRSMGRRVAIKEYLPENTGSRRADGSVWPLSSSCAGAYRRGLTRFLDEARTLAGMDHACIQRVLRVMEARGTAYMVMEHVDGRNLEETLQAEGPWSEERVRALLDALLPGLALLHGAWLLHRDVKPESVMLRGDGTPVLIDFGATLYASDRQKTYVLTWMLTPGYAPYENYGFQPKEEQGPWTDIYALGALAYRALTGRMPAEAVERVGAAQRGQTDPLAPLAEVAVGGVSESFAAAVMAALAVRPKDRPRVVAAWRVQWDGGGMAGGKDDLAV